MTGILGALDGVGGQRYLEEQARLNPTAFTALVGKLVPAVSKVETTPFVVEIASPIIRKTVEQ